MLHRCAIFLILFLNGWGAWSGSYAHAAMDVEINESLQKQDWPNLVLILKPKEGQNFEQDMILARALLSLERRPEALKTLNGMAALKKEERAQKMLDLASTQFFSQETSNLYYEALNLIMTSHWLEAREKLDQALLKEPAQGLVLLRMVQLDFLLARKESLAEDLKTALLYNPSAWGDAGTSLRVFQAKALSDQGENREALKLFQSVKDKVFSAELPTVWYLEVLSRLGKITDLTAVRKRILKEHPDWSFVLLWFVKNNRFASHDLKSIQTQLQKNTHDISHFAAQVESNLKRSQYLWAGHYSAETIRVEVEKLNEGSHQKR